MSYDTIIVGGGTAGAILAARLTENPNRSVLLLEAGPNHTSIDKLPDDVKWGYGEPISPKNRFDSPTRSHYVARAVPGRSMIVPRGRVTGGSSAVNAQIFLRGLPEDFDDWAGWGNDRWSHEKLTRFHRRIENDQDFGGDFHGGDGPIIVRRDPPERWMPDQKAWYHACRDIGFSECSDHNNDYATGVGPTPFNTVDRIRWSTALGYLDPAKNRPNLTIQTNSRVDNIIFARNRAIGVRGESFSVYGEEIILACGAIGSPHLLMLSGVGPSNHLTQFDIPVVHNSPGVGQNLRDHPQVPVMFHTRYTLDENFETHGTQVLLRYTAAGSKQRNDMLIHPFAQSGRSLYYSRSMNNLRSYGMLACLYLAEGSGTLSLMSPDPQTQPFLNYNYLVNDWDRSRLRESVRICIKIAEQKTMSQIIRGPMDPTESDMMSDDLLDAWLLANVRTSHHISGTCKMGPTYENMSVVDQFGKVHGINGLRVADASIMPDCVRANTNVTTMVIGERIAEFVQEGH